MYVCVFLAESSTSSFTASHDKSAASGAVGTTITKTAADRKGEESKMKQRTSRSVQKLY